MNKTITSIDLMKFIFSILVIVVHTYPFYETLPDVGFITSNIIGRCAIPFFFVSAGYFLEKGLKNKPKNYFKQYIKRLFILYILWSIICIPAGVHLLSNYIEITTPLIWPLGIVVGFLYAGTYYHLWYMNALIFAIIFCVFWLKKFSIKSLLIISALLLCFGLTETYFGLFENTFIYNTLSSYYSIFVTSRNGLFFGIFYVALGIYNAKEDCNLKIKHSLLKTILFFLLFFIEAQIVRYYGWAIDYNFYILIIPFTFYFFNWLLNHPCKLKLDYKALREYSTIIYFSHGMFLAYVPWFLPQDLKYLYDLGWFRLSSVLSLTLLTSYFIRKKLKYLY